jgi:hypothetical protein
MSELTEIMGYAKRNRFRYETMADIRKRQKDICMGADYRILGQPGQYRVIDEQPEYIVFERHGMSEMFQEPYQYPVSYHRTDLCGMELIPCYE